MKNLRDPFKLIIQEFKEIETLEDCLIITDPTFAYRESLQRVLMAWGKIKLTVKKNKELPGDTLGEKWEWLWQQCSWNMQQLQDAAGVYNKNIEQLIKLLQLNRLIYPDGTISKFSRIAVKKSLAYHLRLRPITPQQPPTSLQ